MSLPVNPGLHVPAEPARVAPAAGQLVQLEFYARDIFLLEARGR